MGWNSWDAYGLSITEAQFRANVAVQHAQLQPFGWQYAVIDEGWFFFNPDARSTPDALHYAIDAHGRYVPVPERFPSAGAEASASAAVVSAPVAPAATGGASAPLASTIEATSFAPLAAWVHAQGLKFGIHIVRGIPRVAVQRDLPVDGSTFRATDAADTTDACPWDPTNWGVRDNAAGQAWYDSLLAQYAAWGVDLLKVDCISDHPYKGAEIRMIHRAIVKAEARTGRPIVLSLSPGPTALAHAAELDQLADMWRISDDVWDVWHDGGGPMPGTGFPQGVEGQFGRAAAWHALPPEFAHAPGKWPDLDMLPVGELRPSPGWGAPRSTRLTPDEQRSMVTLWAIAQSPLVLGANLTLLDAPTLALLTNREVLRIDQQPAPVGYAVELPGLPANQSAALRMWVAPLQPAGAAKGTHGAAKGNHGDAKGPHGRAQTALAFFNLGDTPLTVDQPLAGLPGIAPKTRIVDVWSGQPMPAGPRVHLQLPPHGCALLETR